MANIDQIITILIKLLRIYINQPKFKILAQSFLTLASAIEEKFKLKHSNTLTQFKIFTYICR